MFIVFIFSDGLKEIHESKNKNQNQGWIRERHVLTRFDKQGKACWVPPGIYRHRTVQAKEGELKVRHLCSSCGQELVINLSITSRILQLTSDGTKDRWRCTLKNS